MNRTKPILIRLFVHNFLSYCRKIHLPTLKKCKLPDQDSLMNKNLILTYGGLLKKIHFPSVDVIDRTDNDYFLLFF